MLRMGYVSRTSRTWFALPYTTNTPISVSGPTGERMEAPGRGSLGAASTIITEYVASTGFLART
jgi:hypothetical protein